MCNNSKCGEGKGRGGGGRGARAMALLAATTSSWSSSSSPHLCSICVAASVMVSTRVIARGNNKNNNNNNRNNSSNNSRSCSSSSGSSSSSSVATRKKNLQLQFLRGSSLLVLQFTTRVAANNIAVIDEVGSSKLHKFSSSTSFVEDKSCCISLQETRISSISNSSSSRRRSNSFCWKQQGRKSRSVRSLGSLRRTRRRIGLPLLVQAFWGRGTEKPTVVEMIPITDEEQFDQLLDSGRPIVVDWMAAWCRKCIYLKPKLEKLAAEFHPHIQFYCVDVNAVPSALVKRAGVTKMPTIQLWKDKEKHAEVIGGDKAWLVLDHVREMVSAIKR